MFDNVTLFAVVNTLETIEVHGEKNLDRMLGCIRALKAMQKQKPEVHKQEDTEVDDG